MGENHQETRETKDLSILETHRQTPPGVILPIKMTEAVPMAKRTNPDAETRDILIPGRPSQWVVDFVYTIRALGFPTTTLVAIAVAGFYVLPWVGAEVVIPLVASATKFADNSAETGKLVANLALEGIEEKKQLLVILDANKKVVEDHNQMLKDQLSVSKSLERKLETLLLEREQ